MTDADLTAIERDIAAGGLTHAQVIALIAEIRRQRHLLDQIDAATGRVEAGLDRVAGQNAEMLAALHHLDAIIEAYQRDGIGPLINAVRQAKEWRGVSVATRDQR